MSISCKICATRPLITPQVSYIGQCHNFRKRVFTHSVRCVMRHNPPVSTMDTLVIENEMKKLWYNHNQHIIMQLANTLKRPSTDVMNYLYKLSFCNFGKAINLRNLEKKSCSVPLATENCDTYFGIFDKHGNLRHPLRTNYLKKLLQTMREIFTESVDVHNGGDVPLTGMFKAIGLNPPGNRSKKDCFGSCVSTGQLRCKFQRFYNIDGQYAGVNAEELVGYRADAIGERVKRLACDGLMKGKGNDAQAYYPNCFGSKYAAVRGSGKFGKFKPENGEETIDFEQDDRLEILNRGGYGSNSEYEQGNYGTRKGYDGEHGVGGIRLGKNYRNGIGYEGEYGVGGIRQGKNYGTGKGYEGEYGGIRQGKNYGTGKGYEGEYGTGGIRKGSYGRGNRQENGSDKKNGVGNNGRGDKGGLEDNRTLPQRIHGRDDRGDNESNNIGLDNQTRENKDGTDTNGNGGKGKRGNDQIERGQGQRRLSPSGKELAKVLSDVNKTERIAGNVHEIIDAVTKVDTHAPTASQNKRKDVITEISDHYSGLADSKKAQKRYLTTPPRVTRGVDTNTNSNEVDAKPKLKVTGRGVRYFGEQTPVLLHEPFDDSKPWTWIKRHPKQLRMGSKGSLSHSRIRRYRRDSVEAKYQKAKRRFSVHSTVSVTSTVSTKSNAMFGGNMFKPSSLDFSSNKKSQSSRNVVSKSRIHGHNKKSTARK